jgi:hypothetical protein
MVFSFPLSDKLANNEMFRAQPEHNQEASDLIDIFEKIL